MYVALQVVHSSCFFRDATLGRSGVAAAEPRTLLAGRTSASDSSSVVSAAIPSMRGAVEGVSAGARVAAHERRARRVREDRLIVSQDVAVDRRGAPEAAQRHGAAQRERRVRGDAEEESFVGGPGEGLCCHLLLVFALRR